MNPFISNMQTRWGRFRREARIRSYLRRGQRPWTAGYGEYRERVVAGILCDQDLMTRFRRNEAMPIDYGRHLDERVVEFPWVLARLEQGGGRLLDAGSALNFLYILNQEALVRKRIVIYTLAPEDVIKGPNISYVYGDLRQTLFHDRAFDEIVCISTLEHIGMDNTRLYSTDAHFEENRPTDYLRAVQEFNRILKPGGRLLVTVPYGRPEYHGWLQQFDRTMVDAVLHTFGGTASAAAYYRYGARGWQISSADGCSDCTYFDIHRRQDYEADYVAAARAVACLEMVK